MSKPITSEPIELGRKFERKVLKRSSQLNCKSIRTRNRIDVFVVRLDEFINNIELLMSFLSQDELLRSLSYKFEKDKCKYILRRSLLRIILSTYIGVSPNKLSFGYNKNGKPYLKNTQFYFNASHSGQHFALAISHLCEMGIDIEEYTEFDDPNTVLKMICNKNEINNLKRVGYRDINDSLLRCWTGKEAYFKKIGSGLTIDPRRIQINIQKRTSGCGKIIFDGIESEGYILRSWKTSGEPILFISIFSDEKACIHFLELTPSVKDLYLEG